MALPLICSDLISARFTGRMSVLASKSPEKGFDRAENLVKSFGWKVLKPMTSVILVPIFWSCCVNDVPLMSVSGLFRNTASYITRDSCSV